MIKEIVTMPDGESILTTECRPFDEAGDKDLFRDLMDTAVSMKSKCAGLSANQIGETVTAFVMRWGNIFVGVANPEILAASPKEVLGLEGCLSLPGRRPVKVRRHKWINVKYWSPHTKKIMTKKLVGRDAVVFQHEMDHGKGILI